MTPKENHWHPFQEIFKVKAEELYKSWKYRCSKQEILKFGAKENEAKRST